MSNTKKADLSRRTMFAGAGTVAALAAAAAALPLARGTATAAAPVAKEPDKGDGYQVTAHVLQYYQTARI